MAFHELEERYHAHLLSVTLHPNDYLRRSILLMLGQMQDLPDYPRVPSTCRVDEPRPSDDHDDPDSGDQHEGENVTRPSQLRTTTTQPTQSTTSQGSQSKGSDKGKGKVDEVMEDADFEMFNNAESYEDNDDAPPGYEPIQIDDDNDDDDDDDYDSNLDLPFGAAKVEATTVTEPEGMHDDEVIHSDIPIVDEPSQPQPDASVPESSSGTGEVGPTTATPPTVQVKVEPEEFEQVRPRTKTTFILPDAFTKQNFIDLEALDSEIEEEVTRHILQDITKKPAPKFRRSTLKDKNNPLIPTKEPQFGKFNKNDERAIDLRVVHGESVLQGVWLEEQAYKIFTSQEKLDKLTVHPRFDPIGIIQFMKDDFIRPMYKFTYKQLRSKDKFDLANQREHRIVRVIGVSSKHLSKRLHIPVWKVRRADGKTYMFCEADLIDLKPVDVLIIYHWMRDEINRKWVTKMAEDRVIVFMRERIRLASQYDLQLGVESVRQKILLSPPNQTTLNQNLNLYTLCTCLEDPEDGFIFYNKKSERIFIRTSELSKYSDGTLRSARKFLDIHKRTGDVTNHQKMLINGVAEEIDRVLDFRVRMRQFDTSPGINRKKNYFAGSQYVPKFVFLHDPIKRFIPPKQYEPNYTPGSDLILARLTATEEQNKAAQDSAPE